MTKRDVVFPPGRLALYERHRHSPAVESNGFLFDSGQVGGRDDGSPQQGPKEQMRQAFENTSSL